MTNTTFKKSNSKSNGTVKASSPKEDYSKMLKKDLVVKVKNLKEINEQYLIDSKRCDKLYGELFAEKTDYKKRASVLKQQNKYLIQLNGKYKKGRDQNKWFAIFFGAAFLMTSLGWLSAVSVG